MKNLFKMGLYTYISIA